VLLSIAQEQTNAVLSWTDAAADYTLQAAPLLTGPWTNINIAPADVAGFFTVTNPMSTNHLFYRLAEQLQGVSRLPILGIASFYGAFDGTSWTNHAGVVGISNALASANLYLKPWGYNYLILDDGWGNTNLDPNGLMQLHEGISNTFGAGSLGVSNFIHAIHTNGWKIGLYVDGGTNLSTGGLQHGVGENLLWTNIAALVRYGVDYIKSDQPWDDKEGIAEIIAASGRPVFLSGSTLEYADSPLPSFVPAMLNSFRCVSGGDLTSYSQLLHWSDVMMTNGWWQWVKPRHFIDMDYVGGVFSVIGDKTHLVACALFSAPVYNDTDSIYGTPDTPWFTNSSVLAIDQDSAAICAQRYLTTNNCDVYLKPLGSRTGANYALGVINRSLTQTNTVTLYFTNLPPLNDSRFANWSVYDCLNNQWIASATNAFSVTLTNYDSCLYKLVGNRLNL
jgi:hypothetical protein